jgi:hypothetical protein
MLDDDIADIAKGLARDLGRTDMMDLVRKNLDPKNDTQKMENKLADEPRPLRPTAPPPARPPFQNESMAAEATVHVHETMLAAQAAAYRFQTRLHDLQARFIADSNNLREQYLHELADIQQR